MRLKSDATKGSRNPITGVITLQYKSKSFLSKTDKVLSSREPPHKEQVQSHQDALNGLLRVEQAKAAELEEFLQETLLGGRLMTLTPPTREDPPGEEVDPMAFIEQCRTERLRFEQMLWNALSQTATQLRGCPFRHPPNICSLSSNLCHAGQTTYGKPKNSKTRVFSRPCSGASMSMVYILFYRDKLV